MKKFLCILLVFSHTIRLQAQNDENLYNPNLAYLKGEKGIKIIKVTSTYNLSDYRTEDFHYFDDKNRNYKTVCYYKDTLQGRYYFKFDKKGQLIREDNYSLWTNEQLDTSKVIWTIDYKYLPNGLVKSIDNTWYDANSAILRIQKFYKYDSKSRLIKEENLSYQLDSLTAKVYFRPNSNSFSDNQNPPNWNHDIKKYKYIKNQTIIENYRKGELKSKIVSIKSKNLITSHLIDIKGDTLRSVITHKNNRGQRIKVQVIGDENISDFGEYGDVGGNSLITYDYNKFGLIELITYHVSKSDYKKFVKFEYINR
ncbi:MAG: hypothetical protein J0M29_19815 [Chitinophagales bacterium]|nr:hypothetical protein [Chitinophagales bacterium]